MIPTGIRVVVFDAVGTVIRPSPGAAESYFEVGRRHGSQLQVAEIRRRFSAAFTREEERDRTAGYRTSEEREVERWRNIVASVLDDVRDPETCFRELFEHFATPAAWRCEVEVDVVLRELAARGYTLALASNYDWRLRPVVAGLAELEPLRTLIISSEVGWRKPAREFFAALCLSVGHEPEQILYVGDDRVNDFDGARAAGLHPLLLDPAAPSTAPDTIRHLRELVESLPKGPATLFVYGTLKRGCRSHHLLGGQEFLGAARTAPRYRMYRHGPYPCLVEVKDGRSIQGEIWRVDEPILQRLDAYEGVPDLFARRLVAIEGVSEDIQAYFFNGDVTALPECGDDWQE